MRALGLASLVVTTLGGCIDDRDVNLPEEPAQVRVESFEYWQWTAPPLDVLIVVDNSASIEPHEARIAANLPALGALIDKAGWVDMHIGIVTADIGCANRSAWRYDAQLTNGQFLIDWRHLDHTFTRNFDGEMPPHLTRLATAGHDGCGEHRPFDAIVSALDPTTGFRRADADLAIVIIGASDDGSTSSIDDVLAAMGPAHDRRQSQVVIAAIPDGASRLHAFAERFEHRIVSSIESDNFLDADWAFGLSRSLVGPPCFDADKLDASEAPGIQASCSISDRVRATDADPDAGEVVYERVLPACTGSNRPCWRFELSPTYCSWDARHYELTIDRIDFPPLGANLVGQCEVVEIP